jgi:hypothetical protein
MWTGFRPRRAAFPAAFVAAVTFAPMALAWQDPLQAANQSLGDATNSILSFTFEERTRWEEKDGVSFGKAVNQQDMLSRLRIGAWFQPLPWLAVYAMGQDCRAPFYGASAPNTLRDTMDLQEGYIEFLGQKKTGFGATFGREMLKYGEMRLIGIPDWTNDLAGQSAARCLQQAGAG